MNCNKKSHFDGMTPVHGQEEGGFGYVSVCKEEVLSQASEKEREKRKGRDAARDAGSEEGRGRELRGEGLNSTCGGCEQRMKEDKKRKQKKKLKVREGGSERGGLHPPLLS